MINGPLTPSYFMMLRLFCGVDASGMEQQNDVEHGPILPSPSLDVSKQKSREDRVIPFLEVNSKRPTPSICDVSRAWPQTVLVLYRMAGLSQAFKKKVGHGEDHIKLPRSAKGFSSAL